MKSSPKKKIEDIRGKVDIFTLEGKKQDPQHRFIKQVIAWEHTVWEGNVDIWTFIENREKGERLPLPGAKMAE